MIQLFKYVGREIVLEFNFGLVEHMIDDFDYTELESIDKLTVGEAEKVLTTEDLEKVLEHMKVVQNHSVFRWGRTFHQEGFGIVERNNVISVGIWWGS